MNEVVRIIIGSLSIFAALGIACAAWLALRGSRWIGRRLSIPPVDPYFHPFGEMPIVPSAGVAHRRNESGGRYPVSPSTSSGPAVVLNFPERSRR